MKRSLLFLLLCSISFGARAEKEKKEDYFDIDIMAQKLGPMKDMRLETIVDSLKAGCTTELETLRALYAWEARFVTFDCKAQRNPDKNSGSASTALMTRKTNAEGYANLFKAMCDIAGIKCNVVAGVYRRGTNAIGDFEAAERQHWNVAEIKGTQYVVDASLGAGYTDEKIKTFTTEYTDAWWLSTRTLFALTHFPDSAKYQLLQVPVSKQEFAGAPLVAPGAIVQNISPFKAMKGVLKGRDDTSALLVFNVLMPENIRKVSVGYDDMPTREAEASLQDNKLTVKAPYGNAGKHELYIFINDKLCYSFKTEVREGPKKKK